jgi:DNA-binding NarL/FixJ family response regulator
VLIVDDHPMTRAGLVHVINHQPDMVVCGEAENAAKALAAVDAGRWERQADGGLKWIRPKFIPGPAA